MNIENIKRAGARQGLVNEANEIMARIENQMSTYKWYECEQHSKELQQLFAELLAESKTQ